MDIELFPLWHIFGKLVEKIVEKDNKHKMVSNKNGF
jgi:hypothetical protein